MKPTYKIVDYVIDRKTRKSPNGDQTPWQVYAGTALIAAGFKGNETAKKAMTNLPMCQAKKAVRALEEAEAKYNATTSDPLVLAYMIVPNEVKLKDVVIP